MTKKMTASFLGALAVAALPIVAAPAASAEVCGDVGGRHVSVGGCTPGIVGGVADAAIAGAAVAGVEDRPYGYGYPPPPPAAAPPLPPGYLPFPSFPGEAPCYLPSGQPYYTPGTMPCY